MSLTPEQITERLEYWRKELGYDAWFFTVVCAKPPTGDIATAYVQPEYKLASFEFDPEEIDEPELDAYIVHEMGAHIATWPLMKAAEIAAGKNKKLKHMVEVANEATTTQVERMILRLKGFPYGGTRRVTRASPFASALK